MSLRALKILLDDCQDNSIPVFGFWWQSEEHRDEDARARARAVDAATLGLDDPGAAELVDAAAVALLCNKAGGIGSWTHTPFFAALRRHVLSRWAELAPSLGKTLCARPYTRHEMALLPELASERALIAQLALSLASGQQSPYLELLRALEPRTRGDARRLLQAALVPGEGPHSRLATLTVLFSRLGLSQGWSRWIKLFGALLVEKRLAQPDWTPTNCPQELKSTDDKTAWENIVSAVAPDIQLRRICERLLPLVDAGGELFERPPEVRVAFVSRLREETEGEQELRQAILEMLLWIPHHAAADLAQFAAVRLTMAEDETFLRDLRTHPVLAVGYAADAVRRAALGPDEEIEDFPRRQPPNLADALARMAQPVEDHWVPPRTWIGDRQTERLIETEVARVETRFADRYPKHGGEGEDRIGSKLLHELSIRLEDLEGLLAAAARGSSARQRTSIKVRYRDIDRPEEGDTGVRGVDSFATDVCFVVDPIWEGQSLGRRAVIVQAKRLYQDKRNKKRFKWNSSYLLKPLQLDHLIAQTPSAFMMFHGPANLGRGVPVMPAQLVRDLAVAQASTGGQIDHDTVGAASQSFADWFTYELLALRIGDPYDELVAKAEGRPGAEAADLLDLPGREVDVIVGAPTPE
jgi:hypothetical protein